MLEEYKSYQAEGKRGERKLGEEDGFMKKESGRKQKETGKGDLLDMGWIENKR